MSDELVTLGPVATNYIAALVLDENNLAEMARHGVSSSEVEQ